VNAIAMLTEGHRDVQRLRDARRKSAERDLAGAR